MSAANEMSWEVCKENVQPLRTGRNVSYLNAGLQISEETSQNLMMEKKKLEEEILSEANKQDPIDPWDRYFKWIQQHNPNGKDGKSLENFLQKYIIKFRDFERYKNDPRYVDAWLTMSQLHDDALVTFAYMHSNHIGVT
uniref:BUB1 N-terminal domain-containing protein n=1 Tax=Ciona savignyi TaxID=51511 RepID=H2YKW7_CIOSA